MSPQVGDLMLAEDLQAHEDAFLENAHSRFCYLDPLRRHATARLLSGLYEGDGLFLLTGQAGIGKTMLLRHLSQQLKALDGVLALCPTDVFACRTGTTLADVFAACETRLELQQLAAAPLKATKKLQQLVESNRSPVLLLDDADLPGDEVLETLITLTGLQAADRRILSVVLAGVPELGARVAAIAGNGEGTASNRVVELQPMVEPELAKLIRHRLRVSGRAEDIFGTDGMARILHHSRGIPLSAVRACQRALQISESRFLKTVTPEIVGEAIGEERTDTTREFAGPVIARVTRPENQLARTASGISRPSPAPVEPKVAFVAPAQSGSAFSSPAEPRPTVVGPAQRPPEPALRRERHASIPEVTVGHHHRPGWNGESDTPPVGNDEAAWWSSNTVHSAGSDWITHDYPLARRRRRKRAALAIMASMLVLICAAAVAVLTGGLRDLSNRAGILSATGKPSIAAPPAYDSRSDAKAWWRAGMPPEPLAPGPAPKEGVSKTEVLEGKPSSALPSVEIGRSGSPIASPPEKNAGDDVLSRAPDAGSPFTSAAPAITEPVSRGEVTPPATPSPQAKTEPQSGLPPPPVKGETSWKPPSPEKADTQPNSATPAAKPASLAKPPAPQSKPAVAATKTAATHNREIEILLSEGDARLEEGDLAGARSAYEQAYDRGSATAAARMAQTFDPRNVAAAGKNASPAEAILWYQDAARKGDRRARAELDDLAAWLENSAASGNKEARRVLELWREPATPADEPSQ